jgi:hypothetical protein
MFNSKNTSKNTNTASNFNMNKAINSVFNKKVNKPNYIPKKINYIFYIKTFAIIILIVLFIYLCISLANYYYTDCYEKKTFFEYLFDFSDHDVCIQKFEPIKIPVKKPKVQPITVPSLFESPKEEVFHIANQDYTYEQSKCKCASYGARLATKNELTEAYNKGANWCSYGWTEGQNAFYPVQKCDWDKLQTSNERLPNDQKKYCGLPGINGGFFPNPEIKFGINCYGVKPKGTLVKAKEPTCDSSNFCSLEQNFQASNKLDTDEIDGFNGLKWNQN